MKKQSQSETNIPVDEIEAALASIRAARAGMKFLSALTPKERQAKRRVRPGTLTLMEDALQAARENPGILPASTPLAVYASEVQACRGLYSILKQLQELSSDVRDTLVTISQEANGTTQQVRVIVKTAARTKPTPGLALLSQRLNPRVVRPIDKTAPEDL